MWVAATSFSKSKQMYKGISESQNEAMIVEYRYKSTIWWLRREKKSQGKLRKVVNQIRFEIIKFLYLLYMWMLKGLMNGSVSTWNIDLCVSKHGFVWQH